MAVFEKWLTMKKLSSFHSPRVSLYQMVTWRQWRNFTQNVSRLGFEMQVVFWWWEVIMMLVGLWNITSLIGVRKMEKFTTINSIIWSICHLVPWQLIGYYSFTGEGISECLSPHPQVLKSSSLILLAAYLLLVVSYFSFFIVTLFFFCTVQQVCVHQWDPWFLLPRYCSYLSHEFVSLSRHSCCSVNVLSLCSHVILSITASAMFSSPELPGNVMAEEWDGEMFPKDSSVQAFGAFSPSNEGAVLLTGS